MRRTVELMQLAAFLGFVGLISQPSLAQQQAAGQQSGAAAEAGAEAGQQSEEQLQGAAAGQQSDETLAAQAAVQPSITDTTLTFQSHTIGANASAGNLEGSACPATYTMISGACHPGYNDRVVIINQFPNRTANTWRCGFQNNNTNSRTVWVYTLCGR